jgi:hypothetical protein
LVVGRADETVGQWRRRIDGDRLASALPLASFWAKAASVSNANNDRLLMIVRNESKTQ